MITITAYKGHLITQRNSRFYVDGYPYDTMEQARHYIDIKISNTEAAAYNYYLQNLQHPQSPFQTYK